MGKNNKKFLVENNDSSGIIGKVILYGILVSFLFSVILCSVSVIISIRTYTMIKDLSKKHEELSAGYESLQSTMAELGSSLDSTSEAISNNSALFSAVISCQSELSGILSEAVTKSTGTYRSVKTDADNKCGSEDINTLDSNKQGNSANDKGGSSPQSTAPETEKTLDRLIEAETYILMTILEGIR